MPVIQTIPLLSFLPFPGEQLCNAFPPTHDSLGSILGLCLGYLKAMHPANLSHTDKTMCASAHLINLFINDPLVKAVLPNSNPASATLTKELNALQIRLVSLENMLINLAKATTEVRKEIKHQPATTAQPAKATGTANKAQSPPPTYAAKAGTPNALARWWTSQLTPGLKIAGHHWLTFAPPLMLPSPTLTTPRYISPP
jgi:hypothetical protein